MSDRDELTIGLIGGSGLGEAVAGGDGVAHDVETPFGRPSGTIGEARWDGVRVLTLARHGPGHLIRPSAVNSRANLFALKALGATHVLATGAVGSLREDYQPRDLAMPDQLIDKTHGRAGTFFEHAAVHVEFADPFDAGLRRLLLDAAGDGARVHDGGCYVCMEGPAFSTRAEARMHRSWGGDLIGMTAMPEAKLAREAELPYALLALVTDYDCWRPRAEGDDGDKHALLAEIVGNLRAATDAGVSLLRRAVALAADRREALLASPHRRALELGIWSDKQQIPPEEVERLDVLWGRYFG